MKNVAITGQGVISCLGLTVSDFCRGLDEGQIPAEAAPWSAETGGNIFHAPVKGFEPTDWMSSRTVGGTDRFAQYAVAAAAEAVKNAGIEEFNPVRTAVIMGTSMAGAQTLLDAQDEYVRGGYEAIPRKLQLMAWPNMAGAQIALRWKLHGPLLTISTACASSLDAIGLAARMIESGMVDVAITGGSDNGGVRTSQLAAARYGMSPIDVEDPKMVCRPFDVNRRGVLGGDGAAVVVLESVSHARARGAQIQGLVRGYGSLSDGYHPSSPNPSGEWEVAAMRAAQAEAELTPSDIGAVVAHATGTPVGDIAEITAINEVFASTPVLATGIKGNVGHTAGAAGAMGVMTGLHSLRTGTLSPTASTTDLDPAIRFEVPLGAPAAAKIDAFQVNAFGFGGQNTSLVVSRD